jgi:hypothetical protein
MTTCQELLSKIFWQRNGHSNGKKANIFIGPSTTNLHIIFKNTLTVRIEQNPSGM